MFKDAANFAKRVSAAAMGEPGKEGAAAKDGAAGKGAAATGSSSGAAAAPSGGQAQVQRDGSKPTKGSGKKGTAPQQTAATAEQGAGLQGGGVARPGAAPVQAQPGENAGAAPTPDGGKGAPQSPAAQSAQPSRRGSDDSTPTRGTAVASQDSTPQHREQNAAASAAQVQQNAAASQMSTAGDPQAALTWLIGVFDKLESSLPKKMAETKKKCSDFIQEVRGDAEALARSRSSGGSADSAPTQPAVKADKYWSVFRDALSEGVNTGNVRLVLGVLEYVHKLIAFGLLNGRGDDPWAPAGAGDRILMDSVIESVSG